MCCRTISVVLALSRTRRSLLAFAALVGVASADSITGEYVEARNAEMWTGPCTHNAQAGLVGDKAILAWRVGEGVFHGQRLDGLAVAAVVYGDRTFGMGAKVKTQTVFVVDKRGDEKQRAALVELDPGVRPTSADDTEVSHRRPSEARPNAMPRLDKYCEWLARLHV